MKELIVDSFAGGGGASEGIELALGHSPDIAINHDREALAMHYANHPDTLHLPHNVWKVDPVEVTKGQPVGLLWASPDCKHFSKAKGGKPVKRNIRDLAWVVVRWAKQVRPRVIILENVEEFRDWGPLTEDGKPCPARKGQTFKQWEGELKRLGYKVEHRELRACDYGAPTIRKRLFLIARRDGRPIMWPKPTHGDPKSEAVKSGRALPWRTAAEIIDWSLPCHSIFLSKEEGRRVGVNRPLADKTMARIAKGLNRYVIDNPKPFIVPTTHHGERRVPGIDEPLATVTGANRGEQALVTPFVSYAQQGGLNRHAGEPLHTVTASRKDQNCIVAPYLERQFTSSACNAADDPVGAITAGGGGKTAVVAPYLVPRYGERPSQEPRTRSVEEPAPVIVPTANGASLVAAFMAQHNTGVVGHDLREPASTILQAGSHQQVVSAGLLSLKGTERRMSSVEEPTRTVLAGGGHAAEVRAFMVKYYGSDQDPQLEEPLHTVTTKDRFGLCTVQIQGEPYVIVDIGMRMLSPRELFSAQGFGEDYIIDRGRCVDTGEWITLTKTASIRMCGNSVSPVMAEALVAANYRENEAALPVRRRASTAPLLEAAE
jgi:DNA (cytosine-5)-methyltransferase 1